MPTTHHWVLFYVFKFIYKSLGNVHGRVWIAAAAAATVEWVTSSGRSRRAVLDVFHWDSTFRENSCLFALFGGGRLAISLLEFCCFFENGGRTKGSNSDLYDDIYLVGEFESLLVTRIESLFLLEFSDNFHQWALKVTKYTQTYEVYAWNSGEPIMFASGKLIYLQEIVSPKLEIL